MDINQRTKRTVSTKVDLTAMVDLGFLLITFFLLSTTFSEPKSMELFKTDESGEISYPESKTLIFILGLRDKVYTYELPDEMNTPKNLKIDSLDFSPSGLRKLIQRRQHEVEVQWGDKDKLMVIIKPLPGSSFKNMVDALDEMLINKVKRYVIAEANTGEDSIVIRKIK